MNEPTRITQGDTITWTTTVQGFSASAGWVLTYYLAQAAEQPIAIQSMAASDGSFLLTIQPVDSEKFTPGKYHWTARASLATGETHTVGTGAFRCLPDPTKPFERRTKAELCLAAIQAVLQKRMGDSIVEYELPNGVKAKHVPHAELLKLEGHYRVIVNLQQGRPFAISIPLRLGRMR